MGYYQTVAAASGPGYIRSADGKFTTYNAPGAPENSSFLISVNNLGAMLGGYVDGSGNADNLFIWGGKSTPLAVPASYGATYQSFQTLNDLGQMVGYYVDAAGLSHGFVASPSLD